MKKLAVTTFALLFVALKLFALTSYSSRYFDVKIHPSEKRLINSLRVGDYNRDLYYAVFTLFKEAAPYLNKYRELLKKIAANSEFKKAGTRKEKADIILRLLHEFLFKAYIEEDPRIVTVMRRGLFNCVSSTALYNLTCSHFKIKTGAAVVPSHIFSVVYVGNKRYEVETTVRYGFDAGNSRKIKDALKRVTGYVRVPPSNGKREYIDNFKLISYLYSQKGNLLGLRGKHVQSLKYFIRSLLAYPSNSPGMSGVQIAYHKLASQEKTRGNFFKSIGIMRELARVLREDENSRKAALHFFSNVIIELMKSNKFKKIFEIINSYRKSQFFKSMIKKLEPEAYRSFADYYQKRNQYKQALQILKHGYGKYPILKEVEPMVYKNWIIELLNNGKYKQSVKLINNNVKRHSRLAKYYDTAYSNWVTKNIQTKNYMKAYEITKEYYVKFNKNPKSKKLLVKFFRFYTSKLITQNRFKQAVNFIKRENNILPVNIFNEIYARLLVVISNKKLNSGDIESAMNYYKIGVNKYPNNEYIKKYGKNFPLRVIHVSRKSSGFDKVPGYLKELKKFSNKNALNRAYSHYYYYSALRNFNSNNFHKAIDNIKTGLSYYQFKYLYSLLHNGTINVIKYYFSRNNIYKAIDFALKSYIISGERRDFKKLYKSVVISVADNLIQNSMKKNAVKVLKQALKVLKKDADIKSKLKKLNIN